MNEATALELERLAVKFRREIYSFKTSTGNGHLASCLSIVDVLTSLYLDDSTFFDRFRDELIFGKAHGGPAIYPILAYLNYFDTAELERYTLPQGILRLHPDSSIPGCNYVGGSLGNAIGFAAGRAFVSHELFHFVLLGDAELYEGSVWESLLFIAHHSLYKVVPIVDRNGYGILGKTEETIKLGDLRGKFESFGFEVKEFDGHSFKSMSEIFSNPPMRPTVYIAETVKGKGVSFLENSAEAHTFIPSSPEQIKKGFDELV